MISRMQWPWLTGKKMSKNLSELSGRKGLEKNLFEELGIAARDTGTPDLNTLEKLSASFLVGKSMLRSVRFTDYGVGNKAKIMSVMQRR